MKKILWYLPIYGIWAVTRAIETDDMEKDGFHYWCTAAVHAISMVALGACTLWSTIFLLR